MAAINNALTRFENDLMFASEGGTLVAPKRLALFMCRRLLATEKPALVEVAALYDFFLLHFDKMVVEQNKTAPTTLESLSIHWQIITTPTGEVAKIVNQWRTQISAARPRASSLWTLGVNCSLRVANGTAWFQDDVIDNNGVLVTEDTAHAITDAVVLCRQEKWAAVRGLIQKHQGLIPPAIGHELLSLSVTSKKKEHCRDLFEAGVVLSLELFFSMVQTWDALDIVDILKIAQPAQAPADLLAEMPAHLASRYKSNQITPNERELFDCVCRIWQSSHPEDQDGLEFHKAVLEAAKIQDCDEKSLRQLTLMLWIIARNSPKKKEIRKLLKLHIAPHVPLANNEFMQRLEVAYQGNDQISGWDFIRVRLRFQNHGDYVIRTVEAFGGNIAVDDLIILEMDDLYSNVSLMKRAYGERLTVENLFKILASHQDQYLMRELMQCQKSRLTVDELFRILDVAENLYFVNRIMAHCRDALSFDSLYFLCQQQARYCKHPIAFCHIIEECLDRSSQVEVDEQVLPNLKSLFEQATADSENLFSYDKEALILFIKQISPSIASELLTHYGCKVIPMIQMLGPSFVSTNEGLEICKALASSVDPLLGAHVYDIAKDVGVALAYTELIAKSPLRVQLEHAIADYDALSLQSFYCHISELAPDELEVALLQVLSAK